MLIKRFHRKDRDLYLHVGFKGDEYMGFIGQLYKEGREVNTGQYQKNKEEFHKIGERLVSLFMSKVYKSFIKAINRHFEELPVSVQDIAVVINPMVLGAKSFYSFEKDITVLAFDMGFDHEWLKSPEIFDEIVEHEFMHGIDPIRRRYHLLINSYKDYLKSHGTKDLWGVGGLIFAAISVRGEGLAGLNENPLSLSKNNLIYFHNNMKGLALGYMKFDNLYYTGVLHWMGDAMARMILLYWRLVDGGEITFAFDVEGRKAELIATRESVGMPGFANDINYLIHKCGQFSADVKFNSDEIKKLKKAMFDMDHMDFIREYEKACIQFRIKKENMIISEESFKELKRMAREARDAHPDELMTHIA